MKCCEYGPRPKNGFIRPLVPHEYIIRKVQLPVYVTRGQCYIAKTAVIYSPFRLNYQSIFKTLNLPWNGSKLLGHFNPRVKITAVNYHGKLL
jgi:hypothetical protein